MIGASNVHTILTTFYRMHRYHMHRYHYAATGEIVKSFISISVLDLALGFQVQCVIYTSAGNRAEISVLSI
jgi:hypothetical protein